MTELSNFIDAHPWVAFGCFLVAANLAASVGKIGRRECRCKDKP